MNPLDIGLQLIEWGEFSNVLQGYNRPPNFSSTTLYARITSPIIFELGERNEGTFLDFLKRCLSHHYAERATFSCQTGSISVSAKNSERIDDLARLVTTDWQEGEESFSLKYRSTNKRNGDSLQTKFTLNEGRILSTYLIVPYVFFEEHPSASEVIGESKRESSGVYSVRGVLYPEDLGKFK